MTEVYYFGSIGDGHFLYDTSYIWYTDRKPPPGFPWLIDQLDGRMLTSWDVQDWYNGKVYWRLIKTTDEHKSDWFVFCWYDRSGDSRPGSNSAFYVKGFHKDQHAEAFQYALQQFKRIADRQKHPLVLIDILPKDEPKRAYYFGCDGKHSSGHRLIDSRGRSVSQQNPPEAMFGFPWSFEFIDGGLLAVKKIKDEESGQVLHFCSPDQNATQLMATWPTWHSFVWWDRSGDSRGGSNSGLYVKGFTNDQVAEAFEFALAQYPEVVKRQRLPLQLQS